MVKNTVQVKNPPSAGAQNIWAVERYATGYDAKTTGKSKTVGSVETAGFTETPGAAEAGGSAESPRKRDAFILS